MQIVVDHLCR